MLDFRYAKNIRKVQQIEKVQSQIKQYDLVFDMVMGDEAKQRLQDLEECLGPKIGSTRMYYLLGSCMGDEPRIVEFMGVKHSEKDSNECVLTYRDMNKDWADNKQYTKSYIDDEIFRLEKGRTIVITCNGVHVWEPDTILSESWFGKKEMSDLRALGYTVTEVGMAWWVSLLDGSQSEESHVVIKIKKTETTDES